MIISKTPFRISFVGGGSDHLTNIHLYQEKLYVLQLINICM